MKVLILVAALISTGCAVKAVDVQTITIQPSPSPVVVTVKGTGISTDMFLVHTAQVILEIESSNGEKPIKVGAPKSK